MGEAENGRLRLDFDGHLRLEFRGARVTTDAGLLAVRELVEALGLTDVDVNEKVHRKWSRKNAPIKSSYFLSAGVPLPSLTI